MKTMLLTPIFVHQTVCRVAAPLLSFELWSPAKHCICSFVSFSLYLFPSLTFFFYFLLPVSKFGNCQVSIVYLCFSADLVRWCLLASVQVWQVRSAVVSSLPRIRILICFAITARISLAMLMIVVAIPVTGLETCWGK